MENFYQVLGISTNATPDEIKRRYRFLVLAYHPDRFPNADSKAQAEEEMKRINEAYAVLSNPEKKANYDQRIGVDTNKAPEHQDPVAEKLLEEAISFLQSLIDKWAHILTDLPVSDELQKIRYLIRQGFFILINCAYQGNDFDQTKAITAKIDFLLSEVVHVNMALGIEKTIRGLPDQYSLSELVIITTIPIYFEIEELKTRIQSLGTTNKDMDDVIPEITKLVLMVCGIAQDIGVQISKTSSNPPVYSTTQQNPSKATTPKQTKPPLTPCDICGRTVPTATFTFKRFIVIL